ncbi:MAG TPA: hypothetical protein DC009_08890, partial [Porphyromonadaceae bacterium]|nr:hypothetical protein [Porphyromonadaceae bacterium]
MKIYDKDGKLILDVEVSDNSFRNRQIMGDHSLTLYWSLAQHKEIPVGAYCLFEGERYTMLRPQSIKMNHSRSFDYTAVFSSSRDKAALWKFRNPADGRLKFPLTAKPSEHLQMLVDNMNRRDSGWTAGDCIDDTEKLISYDHDTCLAALAKMAEAFGTEYEIDGKRVSLHKVEYNKSSPLALSYGKGKGFKPGVGRANSGDTPPVEILYVQGGDRNIDRSKYPEDEAQRALANGCLLLPAGKTLSYDGKHFEDEDGYAAANARRYVADDLGLSIRNAARTLSTLTEDSLDRSDDYPKREGTISSVVTVDEESNFYDFIDDSIPEELDYSECLIEGESMTVVFQSGMLAGREFDVKYCHEAAAGKAARRFEVVPQELDGIMMPGGSFVPKAGDTYAVFGCMLPAAYIRNDSTKSGASWDMFRAAVKYLFDNEEDKFSFTGELDGIWAKKDWTDIGGKIRLGGFVSFTSEQFQKQGALVRITGIKDYVNKPHCPKIELSNETVGTGVASSLNSLAAQEVAIEESRRDAIQFTKRRFRDAKETMQMLSEALLDSFTEGISPIAVQTMQMLVGDESLQFRFVSSAVNPVQAAHAVTYDSEAKTLTAAAGIIQHLTLGIGSLAPSHDPSEYRYWQMPEYTSARLDDGAKRYYLYAKVKSGGSGGSVTASGNSFLLSETAIGLEQVTGHYHLLVGILNSEYAGGRSFVPLYGFTEILPGRVTTDRVVSEDGGSYFDMAANAMKLGDALDFNSAGDGKLRIKGTIVQSQSGDESYVGCYRGVFDLAVTYYNGDEVTYTDNGITSMYRMVSDTPCRGIAPTSTLHWQVIAQGSQGEKGDKGEPGDKGDDFTPNLINGGGAKMTSSTYLLGSCPWDGRPAAGTRCTLTICGKVGAKDTGIVLFQNEGHTQITGEFHFKTETVKSFPFVVTDSTTAKKTDINFYHYPNDSDFDPDTCVKWAVVTVGDTVVKAWMPSASEMKGAPGADGKDGADGKNGSPGNYTEMRYAKNGSTSTPPAVARTALNPTGWTTAMPSVGLLEYLWMISAVKSGDGLSLVSNWSTPVRVTPYNGVDGKDGASYSPNLLTGSGRQLSSSAYLLGKYAWASRPDNGTSCTLTICAKVGAKDDAIVLFQNEGYTQIGDFTSKTETVKSYPLNVIGAMGAPSTDIAFYHYPNDSSFDTGTYVKWAVVTLGKDMPAAAWVPSLAEMKGEKGDASPSLVFRGEYDSAATYYGNSTRVDAVRYNSHYYIARSDAGAFSNTLPTRKTKWNDFGAEFETVATQLLLAENANIAGWIFKDGKLCSQSGNTYLDGKTGDVRLKGTVQHSTGTAGAFSDVDIFTLPARTSVMTEAINMGHDRDDIGKRCIMTNSSGFGSNGYYRIALCEFGVAADTGAGVPSEVSSYTETFLIAPQETVEMTCFELPAGSKVAGVAVSPGGYWKITNRYNKEMPPVVAMGMVTNSAASPGATIQGTSIAGTSGFAVSRGSTAALDGTYTVTLPSFFSMAQNMLIMVTGVGACQGHTSAVKASVISQSGNK